MQMPANTYRRLMELYLRTKQWAFIIAAALLSQIVARRGNQPSTSYPKLRIVSLFKIFLLPGKNYCLKAVQQHKNCGRPALARTRGRATLAHKNTCRNMI